MTPKEQIHVLRCSKCGRAPTAAEEAEMFTSFGHKLTDKPPRHGERLVWDCKRCFPDGGTV